MKFHLRSRLISLLLLARAATAATDKQSLAGDWRFALDRADTGITERWFAKELADRIKVPGVLQAQGYGDAISTNTPWVLSLYDRNWFQREDYQAYAKPGNVKVPFISQPPRHYLGAAWYQRDIEIPASWHSRRVALRLERPRWESTVWVDERKIASNNSLVAPHDYDLGQLAPGKHRLTIRLDNRMILPYRPDAHSVSDSLGSTWNGIAGRIELSATPTVWIEDAQVFPNVAQKSARIEVHLGNMTGKAGAGTLSAGGVSAPVTWSVDGGAAKLEVSLGADAKLWDEFQLALQQLTLKLQSTAGTDQRELVFGLREFRATGNQFTINGRPVHLRGTHTGGDFPRTGYPPTDVEAWKQIIRTCQAWGLNHMRFHSWCPPDAAFTAADELGFYLQPECGMWNTFNPGSEMETMLQAETQRMLKAYGNHPSFVMLSPSNEPKGRWKQVLPKWAAQWRAADPRRLYTSGTGFTDADAPGPLDQVDFTTTGRIGRKYVRGKPVWFGRDYAASLRGVTVPVVAHELGQWCAYPDFAVIAKFNGGYLQPGNYEIFRDSAAAHGVLEKNHDFARASGRYQLACYKEEVEANLRTPGLAGFQLLDLHDYLGQGTALVGLLDAFWEEKGYATAAEFRRFCGPTVPLARLTERVFTTTNTFSVPVEIAHFGAAPLTNAALTWRIVDARNTAVATGNFPPRTIPVGEGTVLGKVSADLSKLPSPAAYRLVVGILGTSVENAWSFWLYPATLTTTPTNDVLVTSRWADAEVRLAAGGKVLFQPRPANLGWTSPPLDRLPIFWNCLMGPNWSRTLGLWCDAKHPALAGFPTEANADWQWAEILRTRTVNLDRLPRTLQPIVQAIDDWNRNYKLGLIFECKVGAGRLLVCSFDLDAENPVARQLRRSLLDYMNGNRFQPTVTVSPADVRGLWFDSLIMRRLGAKAEGAAAFAIDGNPGTIWQAGDAKKPRQPQSLAISFPAPVAMDGLNLMPRQNDRDHAGDVRGFAVHISDDGQQWREVMRGELTSSFEPKTIRFPATVTAQHLKFTALSGFGSDTTAALAELAVIYAGPRLPDTDLAPVQYRRVRSTSTDIDDGTEAK